MALSDNTARWQSKLQFFNYHEAPFISCGHYALHQQTGSRSSSGTHSRDHPRTICKRMLSISMIMRSCTTGCVAYERRRKRLLIVRRGARGMGVCVCATAQDEGTVVAPMRLQSRANWTNKRLAASYCWRYRLRCWRATSSYISTYNVGNVRQTLP